MEAIKCLIVPQLEVGPHEPFNTLCSMVTGLVLCWQPWVHDLNSHIESIRYCFALVLLDFWLFQSFCLVFWNGPCAGNGSVIWMCGLLQTAPLTHILCTFVRCEFLHCPLHRENTLMSSESYTHLWIGGYKFGKQADTICVHQSNSSRFILGVNTTMGSWLDLLYSARRGFPPMEQTLNLIIKLVVTPIIFMRL